MPAQRWIIHVDLDAFFASVEELRNPALRGKPIIVGGDPSSRGVVSSASYAARAYGVRSAMPVAQALRLCPQAILITPEHDEYEVRSRAVMDILHDVTPVVEQVSIDEAFLDVTGCERLWGPVETIGRMIQQRVMDEQELPVSLGIASSKLVAKIACGQGKPHGLVVVEAGKEAEYLAPLPIEALWGVGRVMAARLHALDIHTIDDLAACSEDQLVQTFGEMGHNLYLGARGIDPSPVQSFRERHSISQEHTYASDTADVEQVRRTLLGMCEHVAARLRDGGMVGQTVRIKLRFSDFDTITRQVRLDQPTDQGPIIYAAAYRLLQRNWPPRRWIRLIGVGVAGLLEEGGYQLSLLDGTDQRRIRLSRALDQIRDRYGNRAIQRASLLRRSRRKDE
ncbi:MAG: DNA polymerase IV [Anaerolineae bacterium]